MDASCGTRPKWGVQVECVAAEFEGSDRCRDQVSFGASRTLLHFNPESFKNTTVVGVYSTQCGLSPAAYIQPAFYALLSTLSRSFIVIYEWG